MKTHTREDAEREYPPPPIAYAVELAREMIDEWDYDADPHCYCHVRPMLIALVNEVSRG